MRGTYSSAPRSRVMQKVGMAWRRRSSTARLVSNTRYCLSCTSISCGSPSVRSRISLWATRRLCRKWPAWRKRRAHARGQLAAHAGQARLRLFAVRGVEILEAVVLDVVPAVGVEAVDGELIAQLVHGMRHQRGGLAREVQHRGAGARPPSRWWTGTDPAAATLRGRGCCVPGAGARAGRARAPSADPPSPRWRRRCRGDRPRAAS